jgi:Fe(II)/alpha-ketoglutarate-dependent arginine beta-hydroxylase
MNTTTTTTGELTRLALTADEAAAVDDLVSHAVARYPSADCPQFLRDAPVHGHELPRRLRAALAEMRALETTAGCVVSGFAVDDEAIGITPLAWHQQPSRRSTLREEVWLVLCGSLLGDVFGWATQQDGAIIHDISPMRGYENSQLGSGSSTLLWWHTEEAFHPYKCDYLGLLSLRNRDHVPTTFATIAGIEMDDDALDILFEPRFYIRPDDSHLGGSKATEVPAGREGRLLLAARARISQMNGRPQKVAVLSGDPAAPYLSIDPFYMEVPDDDPPARIALSRLCQAIDDRLREVVLEAGDLLFIDNYRAVHGRKPFQARYDGTDRWLKRINVTRDLRKSRAHRVTSGSRVIY